MAGERGWGQTSSVLERFIRGLFHLFPREFSTCRSYIFINPFFVVVLVTAALSHPRVPVHA